MRLVERSVELRELRQAVAGARAGRGSVLVIDGPAGVGKTALLDAVADIVARSGRRCLRARGAELERRHGFGVVRQLFERELLEAAPEARRRLLSGAAGLAAPLLVSRRAAGPARSLDPAFGLLHGLYWLVSNLAADDSLVLAVDDAHWADEASLTWLHYLGTRIDELPVALVLAAREATSAASRLALVAGVETARIVEPRPLSLAGTAEMLRSRGGFSEPELAAAAHAATGGNPLLLVQLLDVFRREGLDRATADAERVARLGTAALEDALGRRLGRLPDAARPLLDAVAVFERAGLSEAAELAGLGRGTARRAAEALVAGGILEGALELRFPHPLLRAAAYNRIPVVERARMHAAAARLLDAAGVDEERVAAHLLTAEPAGVQRNVDVLRAAAARAMASGALSEAIAYGRRALQEPPRDAVLAEVLLEVGTAEAAVRDPAAAHHLSAAAQRAGASPIAAHATQALARFLITSDRVDEAIRTLTGALARLPPEETETRLRLEGERLAIGGMDISRRPQLRAERFVDPAEASAGDTPGQRLFLAAHSLHLAMEATARASAEAATAAWGRGALLADNGPAVPLLVMPLNALAFAGRIDEAVAGYSEVLAAARAAGSAAGHAAASCFRGGVHWLAGDLHVAEADVRSALDSPLPRDEWLLLYAAAVAFLVLVLLDRGDVHGAGEAYDSAALPDALVTASPFHLLLAARSRLLIAKGAVDDGLEGLLLYGRHLDQAGVRTPSGLTWRPEATRALLLLGRTEEAADLARRELTAARRYGAPRPLGEALRALALVAGGDRSIDLLEESVDVLAPSRARLELARSLGRLGAALRRLRRVTEARDRLSRALDLAHRCGARALEEELRTELLAAGARPRRAATTGVDALTASERRIADMAASGMSNVEIAQALFVTRKTVEKHLSSAYAKLGIHSRAELPAALRAPGATADVPAGPKRPRTRLDTPG